MIRSLPPPPQLHLSQATLSSSICILFLGKIYENSILLPKNQKKQTTVKIAALDSTVFSHPEPNPVPLSLSPADCSHLPGWLWALTPDHILLCSPVCFSLKSKSTLQLTKSND